MLDSVATVLAVKVKQSTACLVTGIVQFIPRHKVDLNEFIRSDSIIFVCLKV